LLFSQDIPPLPLLDGEDDDDVQDENMFSFTALTLRCFRFSLQEVRVLILPTVTVPASHREEKNICSTYHLNSAVRISTFVYQESEWLTCISVLFAAGVFPVLFLLRTQITSRRHKVSAPFFLCLHTFSKKLSLSPGQQHPFCIDALLVQTIFLQWGRGKWLG